MKKYLIYLPLTLALLAAGTWIYNHDMSLARASDILKVREEIRLMNERYANDAKKSRALYLDKRIWTIQQRFLKYPIDQITKEMLKDLEIELQQLRREGY